MLKVLSHLFMQYEYWEIMTNLVIRFKFYSINDIWPGLMQTVL